MQNLVFNIFHYGASGVPLSVTIDPGSATLSLVQPNTVYGPVLLSVTPVVASTSHTFQYLLTASLPAGFSSGVSTAVLQWTTGGLAHSVSASVTLISTLPSQGIVTTLVSGPPPTSPNNFSISGQLPPALKPGYVVQELSVPYGPSVLLYSPGNTRPTRVVRVNPDGYWIIPGIYPGDYTVAIVWTGYTFSSTPLTIINGDIVGVTLAGALTKLYTIGGRVTLSDGSGLSGVIVSNGLSSTMTKLDGTYLLVNLTPGVNLVSASCFNYILDPAQTVAIQTASVPNINFLATYVPPGQASPPVMIPPTGVYNGNYIHSNIPTL